MLGDRNFGTFANLVLLKRQGAEGVFRRHQARGAGVQNLKRLGKDDHLVRWHIRPHRAPGWLDASVELPLTFVVREVTFQVTQPGFRTQSVTLVTTLLDAESSPAEALAELYLRRWRMELWLRDIKITMDMDMLRTKTPARVRAELAMFLVGDNLIRTVMFDTFKQTPCGRTRILARCIPWSHRYILGSQSAACRPDTHHEPWPRQPPHQ